MVYAFSYDTLRVFRRIVVHRSTAWIAAEDIVYWIVVALHAYITFYQGMSGAVRVYILVAMAAGVLLYRVAAGRYYVGCVTYLKRILKNSLKVLKKN